MPKTLAGRLRAAPWWWGLTGVVAAVWLLAWLDRDAIGVVEDWLQSSVIGIPRREAVWALQANHWIHAVTGAAAVIWLGWLTGRRRWWLALAVVAAIAVVDESLQRFNPHRKARLGDAIASLAGAGLAAVGVRCMGREERVTGD